MKANKYDKCCKCWSKVKSTGVVTGTNNMSWHAVW